MKFASFSEASAFAKKHAKIRGESVQLLRSGDGWIVPDLATADDVDDYDEFDFLDYHFIDYLAERFDRSCEPDPRWREDEGIRMVPDDHASDFKEDDDSHDVFYNSRFMESPELSGDIRAYINELGRRFPGIIEIWLMGSCANASAGSTSDGDLLIFAFAAASVFEQIAAQPDLHRTDVDLLVVNLHSKDFAKPWGEHKVGNLRRWKWRKVTDKYATYESAKWVPDQEGMAEGHSTLGYLETRSLHAFRVWPG